MMQFQQSIPQGVPLTLAQLQFAGVKNIQWSEDATPPREVNSIDEAQPVAVAMQAEIGGREISGVAPFSGKWGRQGNFYYDKPISMGVFLEMGERVRQNPEFQFEPIHFPRYAEPDELLAQGSDSAFCRLTYEFGDHFKFNALMRGALFFLDPESDLFKTIAGKFPALTNVTDTHSYLSQTGLSEFWENLIAYEKDTHPRWNEFENEEMEKREILSTANQFENFARRLEAAHLFGPACLAYLTALRCLMDIKKEDRSQDMSDKIDWFDQKVQDLKPNGSFLAVTEYLAFHNKTLSDCVSYLTDEERALCESVPGLENDTITKLGILKHLKQDFWILKFLDSHARTLQHWRKKENWSPEKWNTIRENMENIRAALCSSTDVVKLEVIGS